MNAPSVAPLRSRSSARAGRALLLSALTASLTVGLLHCDDPSQFLAAGQAGGPKGVLEGTVTYAGPLPCTENQHVLGAALLLIFDVRALPPPEGLGTTASSLAALSGDKLFASVKGRLTFNGDGSRWCPAKSADPVTVSGSWAAAPLDAATYEVRGFYDYDGNFDPGFSISKLPTKGDIGGGAIDNAADVLVGKAPIYRKIALGDLRSDGTRVIPKTGAHIGGIAVTLALPLPLDTPVFYTKEVLDETPVKNTDVRTVRMPSDFQLATFSSNPATVAATEKSFIRMKLGAGVPMDEAAAAEAPPFGLPIKTAAFVYSRQDVNGDGVLDIKDDHVPDSAQIFSLFPLSVFTKLNEPDAEQTKHKVQVLSNQAYPVVVMQGLTLYKSLFSTALLPSKLDPQSELIVALRPAALCIDTTDPSAAGVLVVSRETDSKGNKIIADEAGVEAALGAQFGRPIKVQYGCLPQGTYGLNLIYGTGQAWTVPNEAGGCALRELPNGDKECCAIQGENSGDVCEAGAPTRARLDSQRGVLIVGPPGDPAYCVKNPTPAVCTFVPPAPSF